jgi:hypothetical protein
MIGEIISDVMTDGFFPSTIVSGNPATNVQLRKLRNHPPTSISND